MITKDMALHMLKDMNDLAESSGGKNYFYDALRDYIEGSDKITNELHDGSEGEPKEGTLLHMVKDLPWQDGAVCVVQDGDRTIKWIPSLPCGSLSSTLGGSGTAPDEEGDWWYTSDGAVYCHGGDSIQDDLPLSSDWDTAVITKEMWESAQ